MLSFLSLLCRSSEDKGSLRVFSHSSMPPIIACLSLLFLLPAPQVGAAASCPDLDPELDRWDPGHDEDNRVNVGRGQKLLLSSSATVHSILITNGGKLVIKDNTSPIVLRTRHIQIENDGQLYIGSESCPFRGNLTIILYGRADDGSVPDDYFGQKYIGVINGGTMEIHGEQKRAWTFLNKTLNPGGLQEGGYYFERSWGHRGIIVHVINPKTGTVVHSDRFDTYKLKGESIRLVQYLNAVDDGMILSIAVNDEGSKNLDDSARKAMTRLGSKHFLHLGFRHPWSFITIKGSPSSSVEDYIEYQGRKGSAVAKVFKLFQAEDGEHFNVSSTSEWVQDVEWTKWLEKPEKAKSKDGERLSDFRAAHPEVCDHPIDIQAVTLAGAKLTTEVLYKSGHDYRFFCRGLEQADSGCRNYRVRFLCGKPVRPKLTVTVDTNVNSTIMRLADDVRSWKAGDKIVVASTDYSMYQAEEFQILPCRACGPNEIKVAGKAMYLHTGEVIDGVDMRAEVGLLTRNIVVMGEMEKQCYNYNTDLCSFFDFDTFGGHIKIGLSFKAVHMEGVELRHMGQQSLGHYPIHFHMAGDVDEKGGYHPATYVKDLSIHHAFSRCVTVHGSNGLLIKDVVGYDTLGHCFFTEDGPEVRNTFDHCLGLVVKPSTLLPSDRDTKMCKTITEGAFPGFVPKPRQDCNAVSTFWLANPHNNLINCAAAGSEETGFWFVLHHVPTGLSAGMYPPGYSEHIPMGTFYNNRAHSNYRAGMIIDNGVKTVPASAKDKRPILTLIAGRYSPHQDADPLKPRQPALIRRFVAYKNQDHGAWLRGGDVWLDDCQFADNGIGLTLASGGTFPHDDGSKQEIKNSLFVGESGNKGTEMMDHSVWGPGGLDHSGRTLPIGQDFPIRGIQFYDGPINVQNCTFRKFAALDGRHTSALAFRLNNVWQSCPNNNVSNVFFEDVPIASRVFFGEPGPWFNGLNLDGDKTSVFHDVDGSVSEYPGSYLIKEDNWLLRHPDCIDVPDWRGSICSGHYAQVYIQAYKSANLKMKIIKNDYYTHPLYLEGALSKSTHYQQYQPVITLQKGYTIHWDKTAPEELAIWLINFNKNDWIQVGLCYPKGTTFSILSDIHDRRLKKTSKTGMFYPALQMEKLEHRYPTKGHYYWDEDTGLLFLKLKAQHEKEPFAFCSVRGCERIRIKANIPRNMEASDCEAKAYPNYAEKSSVDVPMPKKLSTAQLNKKEHFVEMKLESYKTKYFHLRDDFAYISVDSKKFYLSEDGIQVVVINGHDGKVVDWITFKNSILQGIPAQIDNYINKIQDNSVVLMTSKGRFISKGPWTKVLEKLGAKTGFKLKEKMAFVGYKGSFRPYWVKLNTDDDAVKIFQALPVPVLKKMKL
ncbi:cell migration-inducing and hyaluronan-binding protein isoform X2 [Varanus komodoensis]|uniref:cell migration-inducing and hyaluronan-binding protein isoform X2 n=1 Tax=Varanus komodoensis TaxID=61221 RepID=UPI001CF7B026|nr:cell migration-inducing and hyaluronan-binding protein isoform X2 [Varanus komodoensis]